MRRHRADHSAGSIVEGLREVGYKVWIIGEPCDLLVRFWSKKAQRFLWQPLECKTPTSTGKRRKRNDQLKQEEFLADTQTPVVLTLDAALLWLENA